MRVCLLSQYSSSIGAGHIIRCSTIFEFFSEYCEVDFFIDSNEKVLLSNNINFEIHNWLSANIEKYYDIILVDTYNIKHLNFKKLKTKTKIIAYMDDGVIDVKDKDVILIRTAVEKIKTNFENICFVGTKYFPIRKSLINAKVIKRDELNALVMFGGTDIRQLSLFLNPLYLKYSNIKFNIVTMNKKIVEEIETAHNINVFFNPNWDELAKIMAYSDFALVSGGTILYELSYMKIPSIVISVIENQNKGIKAFLDLGFIDEYYSYNENNLIEKIEKKISSVLENYDSFRKFAELGRRIVDGNGARNLVLELIKHCKEW